MLSAARHAARVASAPHRMPLSRCTLGAASLLRSGAPTDLRAVTFRGLTTQAAGEPAAAPAAPSRQIDQNLDPSQLLTAVSYTQEELAGVQETHREPGDWVDRAAYRSVQLLRGAFDLVSLYKIRSSRNTMQEGDWLRRIIFLETVAGVPGMVAGMARHLHSLRLMRRDYGWIHALLAEAENERMHLLIALSLRRPGIFFRSAVIGGQFIFLAWYSISYLLCPRYCHRFVGYLEEEAVHTYTTLLEAIDRGDLPLFENLAAPRMARIYYQLPKEAMLRDVFERIRADESAHRDTNHHFSDLKPDEPNTMVEHLRQGHFQNQDMSYAKVAHDEDETEERDSIKESMRT